MKERILKTVEAYLITNEDVLEEDQKQDIKEQIQAIKQYKENWWHRRKGDKN
jgi:thiamine phosphate synthase YjbQ (UPF0047 family)